ncbi:choice-of-anchor L domain-containing protein [Marinifilum sp.]|uniref:choice-of-anchor L domain-containing protein n=1 Tax=Marinifilum sp. TaxID=2033137 RepID=UPI003BA92BCA
MTKHFYIKFPLLILTLCLLSGSFFAQNLSAQVTIWEEDFSSYANGVTSGGNNGVTWSISGNYSDYWFEVRNEKLELRDNNRNVAEWLTSSIDISAYTNVSISLNAQESGKLESQGTDDEDYILFQYQIDGDGNWHDFDSSPWYDDFPENNVDRNATVNSLNGSSLQVRVRFRNGTGRQEYYRIDDVIVSGYPNVGNSPTANCKDITIQLDGSGNKSITADDINNGSSDVETADADLILSLDKTSFNCADVGIQTVTLTVEDGDGNKSTCTANVTVEDNVAPSLLNLNAEYHDGMSLSDLKYSESVDEAHTNWGGSSPNTGLLGNDQFSIRYSGNFVVPETGNYTFYTNSDDGVRLQIDGAYVINNWTNHAPTVNSGTVNLTKGQHSITLEFYENGGGAVIELEWASALAGVTRETFSKSSILNHTTVETTVKLDASGNATLAAADVDPGFLDNCSVTSRSLSKSDFTTADIGVNTVVLTVQDASGNSTNINVLVTVEDNNDPSTASIEVDVQSPENAYSTSELVQKVLVTGCLTASNIVYSGDENYGIGYFNAVDSDFPLASGIILSTGRVKNAEGPNNSGSESQNIAGIAGDVDVSVLTGDNENDAQVLEFDFVPAGDILEFRYIFASEEYPEYACSNYNDVFAFIISGPGITADTDLSGKNIALIPGTTNPVTINNVNDSYCGNSTYYVDESSGYATQFDGRTTVLTATANVQACQTYHIRLIIADVLDDQYNSAVFLEANSFKSNEVQIDNMIGGIEGDQDVMYEGCEGSFIRFLRSEGYDINEEIVFDINITGTANNETSGSQDYVYTDASGNVIGDGVFPSSIIIPAGQEYIDYHYKALDEGEVEDDETIRFRVDRCPCDGSDYFEKTVTIINAPKVNAVASAAIQCDGIGNPTATITVQLIDGISTANYLYSFDGGATFGSDNVKNIASAFADGHDLVGQTFNIVVRDMFSCSNNTLNLTTTIPDIQPIEADAGGDRNMCTGNGIQLLGSGGIYYEWTCDTPGIVENYLSDPNVSNPWISDDIPAGSYVFTLLVQDQAGASAICSDQESMTLTVLPSPVVNSVFAGKYELCSSEQTSLQADVNMSVSYEWNPSSGLDNANNANPVFSANVVSEESRSYTLTVTAGNGCSTVANLENAITVYPNPSIALNTVLSNFCSDGSNGELHVDVTGGTPETSSPFYTYAWSHNASLNSAAATGLSDGSYTITVTDAKSCKASMDVQVTEQPKTKGIIFE